MDIPTWIYFLPIIVIVVGLLSKTKGIDPAKHSYSLNPKLLSPAERSFYGVLILAVPDSMSVFIKIRVADILKPTKGQNRSNWQRAFNRISSKHFDFVLCRKDDLSIVCAVELNDKSHNKPKRKKRDQFLRAASKSAELPLVEVEAKRNYSVSELRDLLAKFNGNPATK